MKILLQQFLAQNHSWSVVGQNIARSLIKQNHDVHLFSTNGIRYFPDDLQSNLIGYFDETTRATYGKVPDDNYDMQISYTAFKNFPLYLSHGTANRFGLWTYEFAGKNALPDGFAKHYKFTDKILPPSHFAKQVFMDSGVPESHLTVIPHGVDFEQINDAVTYKLKTQKSTTILAVIAQVHRRKNLAGMLEMYGKAFTNKDDVCLVLKVQDRDPKQAFELSFKDLFNQFKDTFKNHAEVEIVREFIPNIYSLYKACDIVFSASHCEGFGMTALEANALGKINVTSRYSGFLDFLNDDNALLIEGKEFTVPPNFLYWTHKFGTKAFMPDIDSGVQQLRTAVTHKERLLDTYKHNITMTKEKYNWDVITKQIMELTNA
jgi:glycosyltransferase involved in cell wall biosynthesis